MSAKNILLLIADDLGRDFMNCYGGESSKNVNLTTHLDNFAASGIRFDKAFTSTASCSGSRTVINTGLHTHETGSYGLIHGRNGFQTLSRVETAPLIFNKLGYRTGILGKVHVGPDKLYPWQVREESESRNVAWIADRAAAFFGSTKEDKKPFFLTIGFVDPHREIQSRGGFGNIDGNHDSRINDVVFAPYETTVPPYLTDVPEVREELAQYYRAIFRMDQGMGMILAELDRAQLTEDTLVLFLSDNGPPFINSKTTLYEAGVRLPFILRVPGRDEIGVTNPNLVSFIDILPTLLDWAGHSGLQAETGNIPRRGRSLLPILTSTVVEPGWDRVFGSHTFHEITNYWPTRFMRNHQFKYHRNVCWRLDFPMAMDLYASLSLEGIRKTATEHSPAMIGQRQLKDYIYRPAQELYDLENDPLEIQNLASDPRYAEILKEMNAALEAWQLETQDLWLWRDGAPVTRYVNSGYIREGLRIPDRFDFDIIPESGNKATFDFSAC